MTAVATMSAALPTRLSKVEARELTERIRTKVKAIEGDLDTLERLFDEARATEAWVSLGYADLDEWCQQEFGASRSTMFRRIRTGKITRAVVEALPAGSPTPRLTGKDTAGIDLRKSGSVAEVAARVREKLVDADPAAGAEIARDAVREVAAKSRREHKRERRPQVGEAAPQAPAIVEEPADPILEHREVVPVSRTVLAQFFGAVEFINDLPDAQSVLAAIPESEWDRLDQISKAARWFAEAQTVMSQSAY